jgi:tRNA pseudouridine38-40 synthase
VIPQQTRNIKITLAYDGTGFFGWQRQAKETTIQGLLEAALEKLCAHPVRVYGSGRTDAGVHAIEQVANFLTTSDRTISEVVRGGNAMLPKAIAIVSAQEVSLDFNARFSAYGKCYVYDFLTGNVRDPLQNNRTWFVGERIDWTSVRQALDYLPGEKDFKAFQSAGGDNSKSTIRTIYQAELSEPAERIKRLTLVGSGFLRHMVRTIAGTLLAVGRNRLSPKDLSTIIDSKNRSESGVVAPPQGLYLKKVYYEPFNQNEPL